MVYVDNMAVGFGRMIMCHCIADTQQELFDMMDKIGVKRKWVQDYNSPREHFDISLSKKKIAISFGAKEITMRELATITANRKDNNSKNI